MLISALLSQRLRESFGEEAADEMVDWMHRIEAERSHLRELNDANFARYDALLGEKFTEQRQEMRLSFAKVHDDFTQLEVRFERRFNDMIRWSLLFWVSSLGTVVALLKFR